MKLAQSRAIRSVMDATRRPRLLLVEDDAGLSRVLSVALREAGYEVDQALDGPAGLEAARATQPDIVLLDLDLPGLYGQVVLRALRRDPATVGLRVIVISAHPDMLRERDQEMVSAALWKPFDLDQILEAIREALAKR